MVTPKPGKHCWATFRLEYKISHKSVICHMTGFGEVTVPRGFWTNSNIKSLVDSCCDGNGRSWDATEESRSLRHVLERYTLFIVPSYPHILPGYQ